MALSTPMVHEALRNGAVAAMAVMTLSLMVCCTSADHNGASADAGQSADAGDSHLGANDPFFLFLAYTRADPVDMTLDARVASSDIVAHAHFDDVQAGRVIDFATGASDPIKTAVFKIAIDDSIKGPAPSFIYVEFPWNLSVRDLRDMLPRRMPLIVIARPVGNDWDPKTYKFDNVGAGLPSGETLREFVFPIGIITESDRGIELPLADDPWAPVLKAKTLDQAADELSSIAKGE